MIFPTSFCMPAGLLIRYPSVAASVGNGSFSQFAAQVIDALQFLEGRTPKQEDENLTLAASPIPRQRNS